MTRDGFVFYRSFAEALEALPADQYKAVMTAVCHYALEGTAPDSLDPLTGAVFTLIRPQLDANNRRYENGKKGAEFGKLGGRPKKGNATPTKPQTNPNKTPQKPLKIK